MRRRGPFVLPTFLMQKVYNLCGCLGFVMSGTIVVGAAVFYTRIPSLTKRYVSELKLELTQMITEMVTGQIDEVMPELPTITGPAVPIKSPF